MRLCVSLRGTCREARPALAFRGLATHRCAGARHERRVVRSCCIAARRLFSRAHRGSACISPDIYRALRCKNHAGGVSRFWGALQGAVQAGFAAFLLLFTAALRCSRHVASAMAGLALIGQSRPSPSLKENLLSVLNSA
jgi:hypothetical protein